MDNEIVIQDTKLALLLRNMLERAGNRNPKFGMLDYTKFTSEELSTITTLRLEDGSFEDISALKHLVNLKDLSIISANAKDIKTDISADAKYNYLMRKNKITDFSVLNSLTSLEFLTISFDDNLTALDLSNLSRLTSLKLDHNPNLTEIKGLDRLTGLSELTLYGSNLSHSINIPDMIQNGLLNDIRLDFDLYPILREQYPNLDDVIYAGQKNGLTCKWQENLSNIRTNELSTTRMSEMDKKAQEILGTIIRPEYSDIEKVSAIYAYITQNVKYDYESLAAAKGEKNSAYQEAANNMGERISTVLDRRQSSYNALMHGKSVCEGYTNMMHYLLNSVGVESKTCSCSADLNNTVVGSNSNHSVIKAQIDGDWYYFDPTWDAEASVFKNFFKTKDEFSTNHILSMTEEFVSTPSQKAYNNAELTEILNRVISDRERKQQSYERDVSSRSEYSTSAHWEAHKKQDIETSHEYNVYHSVTDFDNKTFSYGLEAPSGNSQEYTEYIGKKLGEEYSRGYSGSKADLATHFAMLETKGRFGDFENPYDRGYETSGYDNPKLLLQLEKVNGISIEEIEDTIGLDSSILKHDIYVATYEIEEWDATLNKNVYKPIKEYYHKGESGELEPMGVGTDGYTTFTIDGIDINVETENVINGEVLEKVTQREMGDRLIKNSIEDSMQNGTVTEVAEITDVNFLKDFAKQCDIPEGWNLIGRTFIISTVNERGEEVFDVVIRSDPESSYEHLTGIEMDSKSQREMYTTTGRTIPGGAKELEKTNTLSEFTTKSGHRYSITRDREGKLGFNEIFRENENIIQGEHIDTYTFSTDDLFKTYENAGIHQNEVNNAFSILERTKKERENTHSQTKDNNFESR